MKKQVFYTEVAYIVGLALLALSAAMMAASDFGVSMVVAPAYILHLAISPYLPFFSFGMAEYSLQAVLLILMVLILREFRLSFLFSFVTAVLYGLILDLFVFLVSFLPASEWGVRLLLFIFGMLMGSAGVSMIFHTYIAPEVYELLVKEVSAKFHINIHKFKTGYDCSSLLLSVAMSFLFFGLWQFEGVKIGTFVVAALNGFLISRWTKLFESLWDFKDGMKLRKYFQ